MVLRDEGAHGVQVGNGGILAISTSGIRSVADLGTDVIPSLISLLEQDALDFDTFVRCYVAAMLILRRSEPTIDEPWQGGLKVTRCPSGQLRFTPGGQIDIMAFRRNVARHVAKIWLRLRRQS